jgi:hypothetical protein
LFFDVGYVLLSRSSYYSIIPEPRSPDGPQTDPIGYFFGGVLEVKPGCDTSKIAIIPEFGNEFESVQEGHAYATDFVLTPRGIVKIPDFCSCAIYPPDYHIDCLCVRLGVRSDPIVDTLDTIQNSIGVSPAETRRRYPWLYTESAYTRRHLGNFMQPIILPPDIPYTAPNFSIPLKMFSFT